ncbi:MAG: type VI secretion system baseplate subunit TssG [Alcaligenaceae bacterium]|nr:type VI secretion system baseplate subunit TssG [Alcaligenaceae bacterium]
MEASSPSAVRQAERLAPDFWQALEQEPYKYSFYHVMRWLDACAGMRKPLGRESLPAHESVRLRQEPSLAFAPATLSQASRNKNGTPVISVLHFGLFGPNGPLPLHLTEYVRERIFHHRDHTLSGFADIFHHRLITLFYRAWADAQSTISMDREENNFTRYIASLINLGEDSLQNRDSVMDHAKYYFTGHLIRQTRNPEGLIQILSTFFNIPVNIQEFVPQWIKLEPNQQLQLGDSLGLGQDTILGTAVRDAQHKFRLVLGPLNRQQFNAFLPGTPKSQQLVHWLRQYIGIELAWDATLELDKNEISGIRLGQQIPLGLGSWMGNRDTAKGHARDVIIDYEHRLQQRQKEIRPVPA